MVDKSEFLLQLTPSLKKNLILFNSTDMQNSPYVFDFLSQLVFEDLACSPNLRNADQLIELIHSKNLTVRFDTHLLIQWYTGLAACVVKIVREGVSPLHLEECLLLIGWIPQYATKFSLLYSQNLSKLQAVLKLYRTKSPPKLIDIKWRLDVELQSNMKGQVNDLWYVVDLILAEDGVQETFRINTSHAHLEDMLTTFKDAYNSAKRLASS